MRFASKIFVALLLGLTMLASVRPAVATDPLDGPGLAPYRFNPAPREELSPTDEAVAQAYRSRLRERLMNLEQREFEAGSLEREQLRGTRRELGRVERLLNQR